MLTLWRHDDCATLFHFEPMEVKQEDKVVERFHFNDSVLLLFVYNQIENSTPCNSNQNRKLYHYFLFVGRCKDFLRTITNQRNKYLQTD